MSKYKYFFVVVLYLYSACTPNSYMCCLFPFPLAWDIHRGHLILNNQTEEDITVYMDTLYITLIESKKIQQHNIRIDHYGQFWINSYLVADIVDSFVNDIVFKHTFSLSAKTNDSLIYNKKLIFMDSLSVLEEGIDIIPHE